MAKRHLPCPTVLRLLLRYEPETGELFWKERAPFWFEDRGKHTRQRSAAIWNARYAGKPAFTADNGQGYRAGGIFNRTMQAHRVAWAMSHGRWPKQVDHKNGEPSDNRLANLREVTISQNMRNRKGLVGVSSQYKGVHKPSRGKKWSANISGKGRERTFLGHFDTEKEAALAYNKAAIRLYGEFAWLNEVT